LIQLEANQVFIPGSFAGFKRWLAKQKPKPAKAKPVGQLAPAHLPKSRSKVDADALLSIIKEAKQIKEQSDVIEAQAEEIKRLKAQVKQ
jgi:hypothetical protein